MGKSSSKLGWHGENGIQEVSDPDSVRTKKQLRAYNNVIEYMKLNCRWLIGAPVSGQEWIIADAMLRYPHLGWTIAVYALAPISKKREDPAASFAPGEVGEMMLGGIKKCLASEQTIVFDMYLSVYVDKNDKPILVRPNSDDPHPRSKAARKMSFSEFNARHSHLIN